MSEARDFWQEEAQDVAGLVARASSADSFERWAAAFELGELGDSAAVGALRGLLNDDDESVREAAEIALTKIASVDSGGRREARGLLADHVSDEEARASHRRRIHTHMDAPPFTPWKIKSLPVPSKGNGWVIEAAVLEIVQTEGPVTGARVARLYTEGCCMGGGSRVSHSGIQAAIRRLISKGKVARSDGFDSDRPERWVLHERGTAGVVLRQRGTRDLRDIPIDEIREAILANLGRSARRGVDRDRAFEAILAFYGAEKDLQVVGGLLADEWSGLLK